MGSLFRWRPAQPEFVVPPFEASTTQRLAELQSRQDAALRLIDGLCRTASGETRDALQDVRLVLRPVAPVVRPATPVPGRS